MQTHAATTKLPSAQARRKARTVAAMGRVRTTGGNRSELPRREPGGPICTDRARHPSGAATARAIDTSALADPAVVLTARAEARAYLVGQGEWDLLDAVDGLQAAAVANGLVAQLGQDTVQSLIATAFNRYCWSAPTW